MLLTLFTLTNSVLFWKWIMALLLIGKYILSHYKFEKRQFKKVKMVGQVGLGASEDLASVVRSRTSPGIPKTPRNPLGIPGIPPNAFTFLTEYKSSLFDSNNNNCDSLKFLGTPLLRILMKPKRKESGCQNLKSPAQTDSAVF